MWVAVGILLAIALGCWLVAKVVSSVAHKPQTDDALSNVPGQAPTNDVAPTSQTWLSKEEADSELVRDERGTLAFRVERREGEFRFVSQESGKQPAPGNLALARLGIFYLNVRGWKNYPAARLKVGDRIDLRRELENKHDPHAIAVARPGSKHIYGYVNKGFARRLAKPLDSGREFVGVVMGRAGVTIAIMPVAVAEELDL
ncbi:HIRAN domain-containing protein [Brevibacterium siliguriense]|uniref:HIRAN domain-containing protein n=1 Tax=Brevibacterium siliguriense TaxID=1136497 RepID=A0A1H1W8V7_9MICO|nr:HIRAN domain-containing protein [Brevibacterium siliguriense]SDS93768.1 HIRAN domain-containing protein [Brevibacterium siliguriense]